jgi:exopolyphosphatase/guanosine-5'-triphosphate,3'-diphosphate pyrophosphatase
VKVLVADVLSSTVDPVWENGRQTRLGRGFYATKSLQPEAIQATAETVAEYAGKAKRLGAISIRVIATSAVRDAVNAHQLIDLIQEIAGLKTEVISGDREAALSFAGLNTRSPPPVGSLLVLDVGGGSTECMVGDARGLDFCRSFPLGSVRLLEQLHPPANPSTGDLAAARDWLQTFLSTHVIPVVGPRLADLKPAEVVGVGGTTAILALIHHEQAVYDRELIERTVFTRGELVNLVDLLWALPLSKRQELPGLPPERADVIPMGAAIYESILNAFDLGTLSASTRGLRYGAMILKT